MDITQSIRSVIVPITMHLIQFYPAKKKSRDEVSSFFHLGGIWGQLKGL